MVLVRWVGGEARKRRYSPIDRRGCATCEASVSSRHQYIRTCSSSSSSRRAQQSRTEHSNPLCNVSRTHYMALKKKKNWKKILHRVEHKRVTRDWLTPIFFFYFLPPRLQNKSWAKSQKQKTLASLTSSFISSWNVVDYFIIYLKRNKNENIPV